MASTFSDSEHKSEHKIDRKSLKRPDSFLKSLGGFFEGIFKHNRIFLGILGGAIMLGSIGAFFYSRMETESHRGRTALYLAEKAYEAELKAITPQTPEKSTGPTGKSSDATKGKETDQAKADAEKPVVSVEYKKLDVEAVFPETIQKLKALEEKYGKSRPAYEARLKLGNLYFNHGNYEKALPWYQKAVDTSASKFDKSLALSLVGYAYENLGKGTSAIESFQKAIDLGEKSLRGDLLMAIARCYETVNDVAKARSTYDRILSDLPNTEYAKNAELYKTRL